jgi:hypothetical protein
MKLLIVLSLTFFVFKSFSFDKSIIPKRAKSIGLVKIHNFDDKSHNVIGSGTGFFISKTRVVTNYHVIEEALFLNPEAGVEGLEHITVAPFEGDRDTVYVKVKIGFLSVEDDMAILEILDEEAKKGPQTPIDLKKQRANLNRLHKKSVMFSLGHPLHELLQASAQKLVYKSDSDFKDYISVWSRYGNYPGFSGSPLFDEEGRLVALMHSYSYLKGEAKLTCSKNGTLGYGTKVDKLVKNLEYYENELLRTKGISAVFKPFEKNLVVPFDFSYIEKAFLKSDPL